MGTMIAGWDKKVGALSAWFPKWPGQKNYSTEIGIHEVVFSL